MDFSTTVAWLAKAALYVVEPAYIKPPSTDADKLAQVIFNANARVPFKGDAWVNYKSGSMIHRITPDLAVVIANVIRAQPIQSSPSMPLSYLLACLCIESAMDPYAMNGNFLGSNPIKDAGGYDVGIAQLKIKYLVLDINGSYTTALSAKDAIPLFIARMVTHVKAAEALTLKPPFTNAYLYATGAYQLGDTGMANWYRAAENTTWPKHCLQVLDLEHSFATALGVPSIFQGLISTIQIVDKSITPNWTKHLIAKMGGEL
jgi:hypothetical protein